MAIKITFKGFLDHIEETKETSNGYMQKMIFRQPAYVDEFGEKRGDDDYFTVAQFGKTESELINPQHYTGKKLEVTCYLNGRSFTTNEGMRYANNINLYDIKILD